MNKSELIDAMAADAGISKASAKLALESFLGGSTLQGGGRVSLVGFGSWSVSQRAARDGKTLKLVRLLKSLLRRLSNLKLELNYQAQLTKF